MHIQSRDAGNSDMITRIAGGLSLLFLALQFIRPALTSPPVRAEVNVPVDVKRILNRACYSCHSNKKRLLWFDEIVPAYQLVVNDVKRGRMALNFSELGAQSKTHQNAVLFEAVSQVLLGAMPPRSYTRLHPDAVVTTDEISLLKRYLLTVTISPAVDADRLSADRQYARWISHGDTSFPVKPAPNGIAFLPEYKNWKVVSFTDRADTNTLKMILGNDVAMQAIAAGQINPWPDGSAFAKVSWRQEHHPNGQIRTGSFEQVAFMLKDHKRYADTAGWAWAQWMGSKLTPFGKDAGFPRACVACHAPLAKNDYVFTAPIAAIKRTP